MRDMILQKRGSEVFVLFLPLSIQLQCLFKTDLAVYVVQLLMRIRVYFLSIQITEGDMTCFK